MEQTYVTVTLCILAAMLTRPAVQTTPGLGDGLQSGIPLHLVIIPDRCKTFRVKHVSCNKLLYKLTLFPAVRLAAFVMLMHYLQFVL